MLCNRDAKILRYVKKNRSVIFGKTKHPYSYEELCDLSEQHYLDLKDYSIPQGEREHPFPGKIFTITKRGESVLSEYYRNKAVLHVTLIASVISAIVGLLSVI